jgi:hypothetical protein
MGEASRWMIAEKSLASSTPHNHNRTPDKSPQCTIITRFLCSHGYGCSFSESSSISRWVVIVDQCESVTVTPPHYHKSTSNSLSHPQRQILHGRLHTISTETINTQIYKGKNKISLFQIINLARVSSSPQELRDLLTYRG